MLLLRQRPIYKTQLLHASNTARAKLTKNYYDALGVGQQATQANIKTAYYELSKIYHPDLNRENPDAGERFRQITIAYETLSNPLSRKQYDRESGFGRQQISAAFSNRRRAFKQGGGTHTATASTAEDEGSDAYYSQAADQWRQRAAEAARKKKSAEQQSRHNSAAASADQQFSSRSSEAGGSGGTANSAAHAQYQPYDDYLKERYSTSETRSATAGSDYEEKPRSSAESATEFGSYVLIIVVVAGVLALSLVERRIYTKDDVYVRMTLDRVKQKAGEVDAAASVPPVAQR